MSETLRDDTPDDFETLGAKGLVKQVDAPASRIMHLGAVRKPIEMDCGASLAPWQDTAYQTYGRALRPTAKNAILILPVP